MAAGLADSADGETVFSRSGVWPSVWPCVSAGPSRRSERGSRGAENSPVGDSQDRSPLLAYSSSIWVVVRLRAWGTRIVWLNIQLTHKSMEQLVITPSPVSNYCGREEVVIIGGKIIHKMGQNMENKLEVKYVSKKHLFLTFTVPRVYGSTRKLFTVYQMHSTVPCFLVWIHHITSLDLMPACWNKVRDFQSVTPTTC